MLLLIVSTTVFAQKEVTKFLGIPVDGFKSEMIQKLKAKGTHIIVQQIVWKENLMEEMLKLQW